MNIFTFIEIYAGTVRKIRRAKFAFLAKLARRQITIGRGLRIDQGFKIYAGGNAFSIVIGDNLAVRRNFSLMLSGAAKLVIGNNTFFNNNCSISCHGYISIGNDCLFGENVKLYDHNHRFDGGDNLFRLQGFSDGQIIIGNNVWIGSNVTILNNVTIGDNVVIGANCLVYQNIESNTVVKRKEGLMMMPLKLKELDDSEISVNGGNRLPL